MFQNPAHVALALAKDLVAAAPLLEFDNYESVRRCISREEVNRTNIRRKLTPASTVLCFVQFQRPTKVDMGPVGLDKFFKVGLKNELHFALSRFCCIVFPVVDFVLVSVALSIITAVQAPTKFEQDVVRKSWTTSLCCWVIS